MGLFDDLFGGLKSLGGGILDATKDLIGQGSQALVSAGIQRAQSEIAGVINDVRGGGGAGGVMRDPFGFPLGGIAGPVTSPRLQTTRITLGDLGRSRSVDEVFGPMGGALTEEQVNARLGLPQFGGVLSSNIEVMPGTLSGESQLEFARRQLESGDFQQAGLGSVVQGGVRVLRDPRTQQLIQRGLTNLNAFLRRPGVQTTLGAGAGVALGEAIDVLQEGAAMTNGPFQVSTGGGGGMMVSGGMPPNQPYRMTPSGRIVPQATTDPNTGIIWVPTKVKSVKVTGRTGGVSIVNRKRRCSPR